MSSLGVRSPWPPPAQRRFHVFGFPVQTSGSFNFVFSQGSEEKGEGAICSPSAKENAGASLRGLCLGRREAGRVPPGSRHTPAAAPPARPAAEEP